MTEKRCETCRWHAHDKTCRKSPPFHYQEGTGSDCDGNARVIHIGQWVYVYDDDWCGEWAAKESEENDDNHV